MKTLITGATGLVGFNVAQALLAEGRELRAAVRDIEAASKILPTEVELVHADVRNATEITNAMRDCQRVFHCAGIPEQWLDNPQRYQDINVQGTKNLVEAALKLKVERFVYTSTIDVFAADKGAAFDESTLDLQPKETYYQRSKQDADKLVTEALEQELPAIFVHPAAVYGPGPSASPGLNEFLRDLSLGKVPSLLPGGMPVVHASDLSDGFLLAEEQTPGSRYILADRYYSLQEIAALVAAHCEGAKIPMTLPNWLAGLVSLCGEGLAKIRKKPPLIPKGQLYFLRWQARPDNTKARMDLGWEPRSLETGIQEFLQTILDPR